MFDQKPLHNSASPIARIVHQWRRERTISLPLKISIYTILSIIFIFPSLLTILGYRNVLGIYLGNPSVATYFSIFLGWPFISYVYFADIANKTIVEISAQTLLIRIKPLPMPGQAHFPLSSIKQFKIIENTQSFGRRVFSRNYIIRARLHNGVEVPIIYNIYTKGQADDYLSRIEQAMRMN